MRRWDAVDDSTDVLAGQLETLLCLLGRPSPKAAARVLRTDWTLRLFPAFKHVDVDDLAEYADQVHECWVRPQNEWLERLQARV